MLREQTKKRDIKVGDDAQDLNQSTGDMDVRSAVLSNDKLLRNITSYVEDTDEYDPSIASRRSRATNKRSLLSMALTCRAFSAPALDELWRVLESFLPLLKLLPFFAVIRGTYILTRRPEEHEWDTFDAYARKVRSFIYVETVSRVPHSFFDRLSHFRATPALPNLQVLSWTSSAHNAGLHFLTSPSITKVYLRGRSDNNNPIIASFIARLIVQANELSHLHISDSMFSEYFFETLDAPRPPLMYRLALLPRLVELSIGIPFVYLLSDEAVYAFPALRRLKIRGNLSHVHQIAESFDNHIKTLELDILPFDEATGREWLDYLDLLKSGNWKVSLESISINHHTQLMQYRMRLIVFMQPFFHFRSLRVLRFDNFPRFSGFTDGNVQQIATSLPRVEELWLPLVGVEGERPTVASLSSFARHSPCLRSLRMSVDARSSPRSAFGFIIPCHPLETLELHGAVECEMSTVVANYLNNLFPNLTSVSSVEMHHNWQLVNDAIISMRDGQ